MTLVDPGKGLPSAEAKAAREQQWRRPTTAAQRKQLRDQRVTQYRGRHPSMQKRGGGS